MEGIITEIMRFSLKDGPGIRTTVFLKGCNMVCRWCHNPETLSLEPQLMRYPALCIGCLECVGACPNGAVELIEVDAAGAGLAADAGAAGDAAFSAEAAGVAAGAATAADTAAGAKSTAALAYHREKCVACGACADKCFSGALVMSGVKMSVDEVMREVIQDIDYYRNSGGGLTISGGEAACQPEFSVELLRAAKEAGISTAIETNMLAAWPIYEKMLPYLDLVMLDIKHSDDAEHRKWTGAGNAEVLSNARRISELKPTIVRTPVIPGVNDNAAEIGRIADIVKTMKNIMSFELLLYNPLGESKYAALDAADEFKGARPAGQPLADELKAAAQKSGVTVKIG